MGNVFVVNMRTSKESRIIKVDRSTPYGNPFPEKKYGRDQCIDMCMAELYQCLTFHKDTQHFKFKVCMNFIQTLAIMLQQGKDVYLGCWCAPLACHGDVWAKLIKGAATRMEERTWKYV